MATRNKRSSATAKVQRTSFSTSGYRGGRHGLTDPTTGKTSHGGRYISRRQQYYNVRVGFGLSGG